MNRSWTISMIIPVYKGGIEFRRCLKSLAYLEPAPLEIIIVSDGDEESSRTASEFHVTVIQLPQRKGPAHARNVGASQAKGDILFFVDADVAVPPNLLNRLTDAFNEPQNATAVIGSYDCNPTAPGIVSQYKNLSHHYVHQHSDENAATFWGACGAVRRDVFLLLGGFDERYRRPCVEDIEFGYRLRAAKYSIRLNKHLQVKHLKQWSLLSLLKSDIFDRGLPWTELVFRYRQFNNDLNLRYSDRISVVLTLSLLFSLIASLVLVHLQIVTVFIATLLFVLNTSLYRFFTAQRGIAFAAAAISLHWLSFLYSGVAFAIGLIRYFGLTFPKFSSKSVQKPRQPVSGQQINSLFSGPGKFPEGGA
jgi:GT2 family glycosyltransferase